MDESPVSPAPVDVDPAYAAAVVAKQRRLGLAEAEALVADLPPDAVQTIVSLGRSGQLPKVRAFLGEIIDGVPVEPASPPRPAKKGGKKAADKPVADTPPAEEKPAA